MLTRYVGIISDKGVESFVLPVGNVPNFLMVRAPSYRQGRVFSVRVGYKKFKQIESLLDSKNKKQALDVVRRVPTFKLIWPQSS